MGSIPVVASIDIHTCPQIPLHTVAAAVHMGLEGVVAHTFAEGRMHNLEEASFGAPVDVQVAAEKPVVGELELHQLESEAAHYYVLRVLMPPPVELCR
jgi:hypothetical protein